MVQHLTLGPPISSFMPTSMGFPSELSLLLKMLCTCGGTRVCQDPTSRACCRQWHRYHTAGFQADTGNIHCSYGEPHKQCLTSHQLRACLHQRAPWAWWQARALTTSRCCSPLTSIASRLRIEHARCGYVTSNCTNGPTQA